MGHRLALWPGVFQEKILISAHKRVTAFLINTENRHSRLTQTSHLSESSAPLAAVVAVTATVCIVLIILDWFREIISAHCKKLWTLNPTLPSATGYTTGGSIPGRPNRYFSTPDVQTGCGPHPASCSMGTAILSRCKKRSGREVNHTRPCSAKV
jgi:hypothetical protein